MRKVRHLEYPEYSLHAPVENGEAELALEESKAVDKDAEREGSLLDENKTEQ